MEGKKLSSFSAFGAFALCFTGSLVVHLLPITSSIIECDMRLVTENVAVLWIMASGSYAWITNKKWNTYSHPDFGKKWEVWKATVVNRIRSKVLCDNVTVEVLFWFESTNDVKAFADVVFLLFISIFILLFIFSTYLYVYVESLPIQTVTSRQTYPCQINCEPNSHPKTLI